MTKPTDLDELRALLEKATPGPWEIEGRYETGVYLIPAEHKGRARGFAVCQEYDRDNYQQTIASLNDDRHGRGGASENAELITALRNAAPALLDELESARAKLDEYEVAMKAYSDECYKRQKKLEAVEALQESANRVIQLSLRYAPSPGATNERDEGGAL